MEELENGKLLFHSYEALKRYCDDPYNPLDKVVLGEEITALNSKDEIGFSIEGLFEDSEYVYGRKELQPALKQLGCIKCN